MSIASLVPSHNLAYRFAFAHSVVGLYGAADVAGAGAAPASICTSSDAQIPPETSRAPNVGRIGGKLQPVRAAASH